jgi:hypothetical protein
MASRRAQDRPGKVERAADHHARGGVAGGDGGERGLDRGGGFGGDAGALGGLGGGFGGQGRGLAGDGDGDQAAQVAGERGHEARDILGVEHPADGPARARRHLRQRRGDGAAGGGVVAAVEPELDARRGLGQRAGAQALHPGGPFGAGDGGVEGGLARAQVAQGRECRAGVLDLVGAGQVGQRQVEKPAFVLEGQPAAFGIGVPVLAVDEERRAEPGGAGLDHLERVFLLRADDAGGAALDYARLLGGDFGERLAQILLMVERDGGDDGERRAVDRRWSRRDGRRDPLRAACSRRRAGEGEKRGAGRDLEIGDRFAAVRGHRIRRARRSGRARSIRCPASRMRSWKRARCGEV